MAENVTRRFKWRTFTSVATAISFLGISITGLVLFITPKGRVAHWTGWEMIGFTKDQWSGLHIWFALTFLIAGACHTAFNWAPLLGCFRDRIRKRYALRPEWILALLLLSVICVGTILSITPFSSLLILNESIKNSWEVPGKQAPIPHAELMTLQQIANKVDGVDADTMLKNLRAQGITVESPNIVIGELAHQHKQTPGQIYTLAVGKILARSTSDDDISLGAFGGGSGIGRLTLKQYCQERELELSQAIRKLQAEGFRAEPDMLLRDIAHGRNAHVSDLLEVLQP